MAIEIVDLPIKIVIFHSYVSLPEGSLRVLTRHRFVFDGQMIFGRGHTGDWANRNTVLTKHMRIFTKQNWSSNGLHFWIPQEQWVWPREKKTPVFSTYTHTHHDGPTNGFFTNWNEDFVGPIWICHMTSKRRWATTDKWLSGRTGLTHKLCSLQTLNGVWSSALNFQVNDQSICCRRREVQLDSYAPQFCWWSFHICFLRWYEVLLFLLRNTTWTRWMSRGSFYSSSFSRLKSCEIMLPSGNLT